MGAFNPGHVEEAGGVAREAAAREGGRRQALPAALHQRARAVRYASTAWGFYLYIRLEND